MGKLVQFESREKNDGSPPRSGTGEGQILIFTGVRYERQGTTPPKPTATSSGGKRKRG